MYNDVIMPVFFRCDTFLIFCFFFLQKEFCNYFVLVLVACYFYNLILVFLYHFLDDNDSVILLTFLCFAHDICFYRSLFIMIKKIMLHGSTFLYKPGFLNIYLWHHFC